LPISASIEIRVPPLTTVVGSYPQPGWLIDRDKLGSKVPRVRTPEIWRVSPRLLEQAQDDATLIAIRDMERAGIDIITDGEMRRESYSNRFALALDGSTWTIPADCQSHRRAHGGAARHGAHPRRRRRSARRTVPARQHRPKRIKITLPGPFTISMQAQDEHYRDEEALAMAYAAAVNEEIARPEGRRRRRDPARRALAAGAP
jgi:5-methyltetrahydropteroyltriglutamate--homocysteine methyltransferase